MWPLGGALSSPFATHSSRRAANMRLMRRTAWRESRNECSQIRMTLQPFARSIRLTFLSRRTFASILFFQNSALLTGGRLLQCLQPCQKHPSTNNATFSLRHAKSGFPIIEKCRLQPLNPDARRRFRTFSSVVMFPLPFTARMLRDRASETKLSLRFETTWT